ncbi:MAG: adenosine deaminase, partial [Anaerolineaceae bacterium]
HLEGSIRMDTLLELNATLKVVDFDLKRFANHFRVINHTPEKFNSFLKKFQVLRKFYQSPEIIQRITRETIEDARNDQVKYLELRFNVAALSEAKRFQYGEVVDWVCQSAANASFEFNLPTRLILSVNRRESVNMAKKTILEAANHLGNGVVGVDLAGNEVDFPAKPFIPVFREAKEYGLGVTIHAGEWGRSENIREAIEDFDADRIGHGIRVVDNPDLMALAKERNIPFEVCVSSNLLTGAVTREEDHPIKEMLANGLAVTLNTDDPSIFDLSFSDEYQMLVDQYHISEQSIQNLVQNGINFAFAENNLKERLKSEIHF